MMAQQLEHLIDLVDSGRVEIRIVPQRRLLPLPYGSLTEIGGDRTLYAEETTIGVAYSAGPGSRHARQTISTALRHACSISESLTLLEQARTRNASSLSSP
nr:Scr1 family TA system antitoxin-like transcriptional regulator [Streptomyces clavuligerus]